MGFDAVEPEQRRRLREALSQAGIETSQLWMKYFSIGGEAGEYEVDAYLNGSFSLPPLQRDILAHAANELIDELPPRLRAPYCDDDDLASRGTRERPSGEPRDRHGPRGEESRRPRRDAGPDQE
ncbi:hypothetical protein ACFFON_02255 [Arthrobacter citreus]|uniref:hypothetical protein n=1 Tax=Arthrobacter TaxID=1663 RepID=UPI001BA50AE2|nr:hypothetical protein [Arthrobacter gandavensis]